MWQFTVYTVLASWQQLAGMSLSDQVVMPSASASHDFT